MNRHVNNGKCEKCQDIFEAYPGFHVGLKAWFEGLQKKDPSAHISCAGRGKVDQEAALASGASKAHYGQSSHNFNAAIDIFRLTQAGASWDRPWFRDSVGTAVYKHNANPDKKFDINWYGMPGAKFFELPHVEVDGWKDLHLALVEPSKTL